MPHGREAAQGTPRHSAQFSTAELADLVEVLDSDWKVTLDITVVSLMKTAIHVGNALVLEGPTAGFTDVQQLASLPDGVMLEFQQATAPRLHRASPRPSAASP